MNEIRTIAQSMAQAARIRAQQPPFFRSAAKPALKHLIRALAAQSTLK